MLHLCSKFQVSRFIHPKVLAIFRTNSFQDPIRTLVQILENPGTHVKYFCMLYLSVEFQVHRFIPSKVLVILKKKTIFKAPSGPWSKLWKTPGHISNIFWCFNSLQNFRPLGSSVSKLLGSRSKTLAIFEKKSFQGPIRPLAQILENPETRVKYFLMLYLLKKILGF